MKISIDDSGSITSDVRLDYNDGSIEDETGYTSSIDATPNSWASKSFGRYEEDNDIRIRAYDILSQTTFDIQQQFYCKNFEDGDERVYFGQLYDLENTTEVEQSYIRGSEEGLYNAWYSQTPTKTQFYNTFYITVDDDEVAYSMSIDGSADEAVEASDMDLTYLWPLKFLIPKSSSHKMVQVNATDIVDNAWAGDDYFFLMNTANASDTLDIYDGDTFELSLNGHHINYSIPESQFTFKNDGTGSYVYPWYEEGALAGFRFQGSKSTSSFHPDVALDFDYEDEVSDLESRTDGWVDQYNISDVGSVVTGCFDSFDTTMLPEVTVTKQWLEENPGWVE